jgi:hypothetical protein
MIQTNGVYEVDGEKNEEMVKKRRKNEKSLDPSMLRPTIITLVPSEKHMINRDLGRLEPTPALIYKNKAQSKK